ncbi:MAG: hypothetical protein U5K73_00670 [Halofilum sp. (in: g-proteobacteria)]|nr:hypothetical protein [Halofilum sp. (in: g-proteobacteria)]
MAYTMNIPGIPVSRWIDGVLEDQANLSQKDNFHAVFFQGHAVNSQTRGPEMKKALEQLDMVVGLGSVSDPSGGDCSERQRRRLPAADLRASSRPTAR